MRERNISENEVAECVIHPDKTVREGTQIYHFQKSVSYGTLEVVGVYRKAHLIVITTYPL